MSGPGAFSVARRRQQFLRRSTPHSVCRVPAAFLCRGRRSLSRAPERIFVGARQSISTLRSSPKTFFVRLAQRSGCQGPARFVSGPGALCQGPGTLCVGARRGDQRSQGLCVGGRDPAVPGALCRTLCRGPVLFLSGFGGLYVGGVGARRSLCRGPALSVGSRRWGPGGSLLRLSLSGPSGLSESVWGGSWRSLCRGPALFLSGFGGLYVGARRSLCRGLALCVGPRRSCAFCDGGPALSAPGALCALCVGARATHPVPPSIRPPIRVPPSSDARSGLDPLSPARCEPPAPIRQLGWAGLPAGPAIRMPPIQPGAFPFSRKEPQTELFGG